MNIIEVTLTLHPKQKRGMNKWACTIEGEQRLVTSGRVQFHAPRFDNIHSRFDVNECVDVKMCWTKRSGVDVHGNPTYYD